VIEVLMQLMMKANRKHNQWKGDSTSNYKFQLKNGLLLKSCPHYWFEEDYQQLTTLYESIETCSCSRNIISPSKLTNHCHGKDITPFFNKKFHEIDELLTHLLKVESTKELTS
jgi:hypothetical protein